MVSVGGKVGARVARWRRGVTDTGTWRLSPPHQKAARSWPPALSQACWTVVLEGSWLSIVEGKSPPPAQLN